MNIAILLRGHIQRTKAMNIAFNNTFIYDKTINSFKENMLKPMNDKNVNYDIYASVKCENGDENTYQRFLTDYNVKNGVLNSDTTQYDDILIGLRLIKECGKNYDMIMITRVDFLYKTTFDKLEYDTEKFNFCWIEPIGNKFDWVCDNFYIFPQKYLDQVIKVYENNKDKFRERYVGQCIISKLIREELGNENIGIIFKDLYYSGTNWNIGYCNNPLYIIYGYDYHFGKIY